MFLDLLQCLLIIVFQVFNLLYFALIACIPLLPLHLEAPLMLIHLLLPIQAPLLIILVPLVQQVVVMRLSRFRGLILEYQFGVGSALQVKFVLCGTTECPLIVLIFLDRFKMLLLLLVLLKL